MQGDNHTSVISLFAGQRLAARVYCNLEMQAQMIPIQFAELGFVSTLRCTQTLKSVVYGSSSSFKERAHFFLLGLNIATKDQRLENH